jgi:hypothetical protein
MKMRKVNERIDVKQASTSVPNKRINLAIVTISRLDALLRDLASTHPDMVHSFQRYGRSNARDFNDSPEPF